MKKHKYILENKNEGLRLEKQSSLPGYDYKTELTHLKIQNYSKILDAGCGTGIVSRYLSQEYPQCEIFGCDFSEARLSEASELAQKTLQQNFPIFFKCDLTNINVPDNTYDYIICRYVFEHLDTPNSVITELKRVLKPTGVLYVINFDGLLQNIYPQAMPKEQLNTLLNNIPYDDNMGRKIPHLLIQHGFQDVFWSNEVVNFNTPELLSSEIELMQERFAFIKNHIGTALGNTELADKYISQHLNIMQQKGTVLFYNKFFVHAQK